MGSALTATGLRMIPEPKFGTAVSLNNAGTVLAVGAPNDGGTDGTSTYFNGRVLIFRLNLAVVGAPGKWKKICVCTSQRCPYIHRHTLMNKEREKKEGGVG
jgi:hypothetical protein